ncbi:Gfo/Idh/MocA family protein [Marinicrinis sediminis]|uniref:Gfo/Idh/MocA family protein n=1 Tax=Marinicrinis sediminis TaxID=1652465 RepID=A0ABW5RGR6_9BACL
MRIAAVGAGAEASANLNKWAAVDGMEIAGIYDENEAVAKQAAAACHTTPYTCMNTMLEEVKPQLILVQGGSASGMAEQIQAAIRSGVDVRCASVLAEDLEQAQAQLDQWQQAAGRVMVLSSSRFDPRFIDLKQAIAGGKIGRFGVMNTTCYMPDNNANLIEAMIRELGMVLDLLGEVKTIYAMQRQQAGVNMMLITLRMASGGIVNMEVCSGYPGEAVRKGEIAGNRGVLRYNDSKHTMQVQQHNSKVAVTPTRLDIRALEADQLAGILTDGERAQQLRAHVDEAVRLASAVLTSVAQGQPVKWGGNHDE